MNKLVTKILKESNVDAKITNDSTKPKFRVKNGQLTLEGIVSAKRYSMKIVDVKGNIIDELSVSIKDSNDIVNRINESIQTLNKLSPIYDNHIKLQEDEEFEDIPEAEPGDIRGALAQLQTIYDSLMDLAEATSKISDYYEEEDVEGKQTIVSFVSAIYDIAMDISDYREDRLEELEEPQEENYKPRMSTKSATKTALEHLTIAECSLQDQATLKNVKEAIKDIRAELTVRGR